MKSPEITPHSGPPGRAFDSSLRRYQSLLTFALWGAIILVGGFHLGLQVVSIGLSAPMGSWETVYAAIARVWPEQYQWTHYVEGHDGYGPGYPTFVRPFLHAGLEVYVAHRLANLVAIILACALVVRLLLQQGCPVRVAAAGTVIFYALNAGSYSIQARPDFLVLLEIAGLFALGDAVARGRLKLGNRFGIGFGLLVLAAFLTKAYAAFAWASVLGYLALFVDWRGAIRVGIISGTILGAGIALFASLNPLYVMEVYRGQVVQAAPSFAWFRQQAADFSLLAGGLLAAALVPLALSLLSRKSSLHPSPTPPSGRYWRWQVLIAAVGLVAGPGWHTGAYLTYFLHLLLVPLLMLAGGQFAAARPAAHRWFDLAFLANLTVLIIAAPAWPRPDAAWAELREDILREPGRVAVDYLMEPIAREKPGIIVVSTGATGYTLKEPFLMPDSSPIVVQARAAATRYLETQAKALFGLEPVDTIYLDCLLLNPAGEGRFSVTPRNDIPHFLGPEMKPYRPVKAYHICPYYFATNAPRQEAGVAKTTIVKFVRQR